MDGTDVIYASGLTGSPLTAYLGSVGGSAPIQIVLPSYNPLLAYVTFDATGSVDLSPGIYNDPDGLGPSVVANSSTTGANGLSGIKAPGQGYLVGLFVPASGPAAPTPPSLNFSDLSSVPGTTKFTALSPALDQVFFVGDGYSGDLNGPILGTQQSFFIPQRAAYLYLGISDAVGYSGTPGGYSGNGGMFTVSYNFGLNTSPPPVPEPGALGLLSLGLASLSLARRRVAPKNSR